MLEKSLETLFRRYRTRGDAHTRGARRPEVTPCGRISTPSGATRTTSSAR